MEDLKVVVLEDSLEVVVVDMKEVVVGDLKVVALEDSLEVVEEDKMEVALGDLMVVVEGDI